MELKEAKKEAIYKVGRNVLMFQQMEHLLKHLVANASVSGYTGELEAESQKLADSVRTKTLGKITGEYLDPAEPTEPLEDLKAPHVSVSFKMDYHTDKKEVLAKLVTERNHLVHHFLVDVEPGSAASWTEAGERLDRQCEKLQAELSELRRVIDLMHDMRKELADYVITDEFREKLLD